jgi:hypothetical protein
MKPLLCLVQPWDADAGARADIRVADALVADAYGLGGFRWLPAVEQRPQLTVETMSLDLDGRVQAARMTIGLAGAFAARNFKWVGAPITLWACPRLEYATRFVEFTGEVRTVRLDLDSKVLRLTCEVSVSLLETDMLTLEYDGSGGAQGDAEMRGALRPAGFGYVQGVEPVWFDKTNWIGQIDGYGNTLAIHRLLEGASDMAVSVGNFASYASLLYAIENGVIEPGRWGTCLAEGLVGLGAPPVKPIGVDATFGYNRLGAMMVRIMNHHAQIPLGKIDTDAFDALDAAVPYNVHLWVKDQRQVRQVIEALAASANAHPIVLPQGPITVSRAVKSAPIATLDRSGSRLPRVTGWESATPVSPYWKIKARTSRPANVLTFDQVNFADDIIDRGTYNPQTVYRQGNVVWLVDGTSWLYINDTPGAGFYPPSHPSHWQQLTGFKGIVTTRHPDGQPSAPPVGSIHFDENDHPWRYDTDNLSFGLDELTFGDDPIGFGDWQDVQDKELLAAVVNLQRVDDDGILTIDEKIRIVVPESSRLESIYQGILEQANALGISIAAATTARGNWLALRNSLVPAWNDLTQDTLITRTDWDAVLDAYRIALEDARTALASPASVSVIPPVNQVVEVDSTNNPSSGQYPRALVPVVKRGVLDIRDDDATSYAIATSGITATVNNTLGDPDKGTITATAGAEGYIDLTVTIGGVPFGPYRILFTKKAAAVVIGGGAEGTLDLGGGIIFSWRSVNVPSNAITNIAYGNGHVYSSFAHAWIEGGQGDSGSQDNNPYITSSTVSQASVRSARDSIAPCKLYAIGI